MNNPKTILCVVGTRPEVIKMVPVIKALKNAEWAKCIILVTAQHREMLDQMLTAFGVTVDYDLNLMQPDQSLSQIVSRMLPEIERIIQKEDPYAVIAQGDTATVFGSALAAFHCGVPFGHVEAGLRTYNLAHPFPEEGYRQMVSRIAHWHFAPTENAAEALRQEGIPSDKICMTGNTCIDTLLQTVEDLPPLREKRERIILLTTHRRENLGKPLVNIFNAVLKIVNKFEDVKLIYPVHPNPHVQELSRAILGGHARIELKAPLDYFGFVDAMRHAYLILTDSGGVQEEAPALGKPVLVLRELTERPEPIERGVSKLIGTDSQEIFDQIALLLENPSQHLSMSKKYFPYGDGGASLKIASFLKDSIN